MGPDYTLIASVLMYTVMARLFDRYNTGVIFSAFAAVLGPFFLGLFLKLILLTGHDLPLSGLIGLNTILLVVLQLIVACGLFYKLGENDESIAVWLAWVVGGAFILFYVLPFLVGLVLPG